MITRTALFATFLFATGALISYGQADHAQPASKQTKGKSAPKARTREKQAPATQSKKFSGGGGAVVFVDPVTGQIRQPDESEIGALLGTATPPQATGTAAPAFVQGPGNAVGLRLGEESMSYMVARKTPDGQIVFECVTGDQAAASGIKVEPARVQQPPQR
jgi:hypothetical protein